MAVLNDRIKEQRIACGKTLLEVAEFLGVKEATVQRYESGAIKNIKHETICALSALFNCTPEYLMGWGETETSSSHLRLLLADSEETMLARFRKLNIKGQELVLDYIDVLNHSGAYAAVEDDLRNIAVMPTTKKITAAARSGDRMEVPAISPEEEDAALPPPYTGDI